MWYFSSMHNRHMPDEGLKVLALVRIFQLVVQLGCGHQTLFSKIYQLAGDDADGNYEGDDNYDGDANCDYSQDYEC